MAEKGIAAIEGGDIYGSGSVFRAREELLRARRDWNSEEQHTDASRERVIGAAINALDRTTDGEMWNRKEYVVYENKSAKNRPILVRMIGQGEEDKVCHFTLPSGREVALGCRQKPDKTYVVTIKGKDGDEVDSLMPEFARSAIELMEQLEEEKD